jgi:hypothetical protein
MRWTRSPKLLICSVACLTLLSVLFLSIVTVGGSAAASPAKFTISTTPPIVPAFSKSIHDYAVRCADDPTTTLTASGGNGQVTVGGESLTEPVNMALPLVADQAVDVTSGTNTYVIRCLPSDFPTYNAVVSGQPQANGYLVTIGTYTVAFDTDGVPVWWFDEPGATPPPYLTGNPIDAKFLSPTTIAWNDANNEYQVRGLDGSLQDIVGGASIPLNDHDLQLLPNGNYLGIEYVTRNCPVDPTQCVDLSSWGLSSQATITDCVIVEVTPQHQVVWSWSVADHIDVAVENANWHSQFPDVIHMNSIEYDGHGGVIFSARHLDAVYRVDMATGAITWKLGGTTTPESLTWVEGNRDIPVGFSGQHFARLLPDGDLTVQDNGTQDGRPVRALRFKINTKKMTATAEEQVTDSRNLSPAFCCGSALNLLGGNWVVNWGYNDYVSELKPNGQPVLTITWPGLSSYRAETLDTSVAALEKGMDSMVAPLLLTGDAAPNPPGPITVTPTGGGTAQVAFSPATDNGSPVSGYTVTVSDAYNPTDPSSGTTFSGTTSPIDVSGLNPADTYWVTVTATNGVGTSAGGSSELFAAAG